MQLSRDEYIEILGNQGRLVGIDYGRARIGCALCDIERKIASPLKIITGRPLWKLHNLLHQEIFSMAEELGLSGIVMGLPITSEGRASQMSTEITTIGGKLELCLGIPVLYWDERYSSQAMERILIRDVDMSRKRRREVLDKIVASYILQGFIDHLRG